MSADDVTEILNVLDAAGVVVWIDGGWGIDALLGTPHRRMPPWLEAPEGVYPAEGLLGRA